jgi:hypothetical protein
LFVMSFVECDFVLTMIVSIVMYDSITSSSDTGSTTTRKQ